MTPGACVLIVPSGPRCSGCLLLIEMHTLTGCILITNVSLTTYIMYMARQSGFEPETPGLEVPYSIQLSYGRTVFVCR